MSQKNIDHSVESRGCFEQLKESLVGASPRIARNLLYILAQRLRRGNSLIRAVTSVLALI